MRLKCSGIQASRSVGKRDLSRPRPFCKPEVENLRARSYRLEFGRQILSVWPLIKQRRRQIMRLHPVQKEVALYNEGFGKDDLLQRKSAGERISELLERIEDPMVLAVDGAWGSGKSYFLKRWVGAHTVENGGTATTVYFDAFANDFLDAPLIAM